jgi:hypothetical protein
MRSRPLRPLGFVLSLARRLWVMGRVGILFEHLRDDGTSDQRLQLGP